MGDLRVLRTGEGAGRGGTVLVEQSDSRRREVVDWNWAFCRLERGVLLVKTPKPNSKNARAAMHTREYREKTIVRSHFFIFFRKTFRFDQSSARDRFKIKYVFKS